MQATLAAIVESSDDAIVGKTLDGTIIELERGRRADLRLHAPTRSSASRSLILLPPERHPGGSRRSSRRSGAGERIDHFETERVRKDGRRLAVSLSVSPIRDAAGRIVGAAKIARDVTARRELEREREELARRASSSAARRGRSGEPRQGRVPRDRLARAAHAALADPRVGAHAARRACSSRTRRAKALETIERNARAQAQLIDDLLDVSRIVAGKMRLEVRPTDLAAVIQAAVDVVRPAADAKGIRLQRRRSTRETGSSSAIPSGLQQVVWNLLSNAIKFTPQGGRVQVVLERVDSHVEIAVSDTGQGFDPGVPPAHLRALPQADSSATGARRARARARDRPAHRRAARRHRARRERGRGARRDVHRQAAARHLPAQRRGGRAPPSDGG